MLTLELLNANAALASLNDEQKNAIVTLSQNDENAVIAAKTGEIYGNLDTDILSTSGIGKNGTEKTYEYAKRVISDLKGKAESVDALQTQIRSLTQKNSALEKSIAEGNGNEQLTKELKQKTADLAKVTSDFVELQKSKDEMAAKFATDIKNMQIDGAMQSAIASIKFKPELPESATKVLMQQAIDKVKGMNPDFEDDGNGGKIIMFHDASGAVMRNKANSLNPYTASELLTKELDSMGVLDKGRQAAGGGTKTPNVGGNAGGAVSIEGAKTRTEAYDAISNVLIAQGLQPGSKEFSEKMTEAWKDNNISSLPEK
jgi:hypothetical protein